MHLKSTTMLVDASYPGFAEQRRMTARRIPIWIVRRGKNGQGTVNEQHAHREGLASSAGHRAGQASNGCSFRNPSLSFDLTSQTQAQPASGSSFGFRKKRS